ncbi:MAG: hypothetical protein QW035_00540 [Candidatus Anstonellales archaeon]
MKRAVLFLLLIGIASAALSVQGINTDKNSYEPGDGGYITVTIGAGALKDVDSVRIDISSPNVLSLPQTLFVGTITAASSTTMQVPLVASSNAESGVYSVSLTIRGIEKNDQGQSVVTEKTTFTVVKVVKKPKISLRLDTTQVQERGEIGITIENKGGKARGLQLKAASPFYLEGQPVYIGDFEGSKKASLGIDSTGAQEGSNILSITATYQDLLGDSYSESFSVPVTVTKGVAGLKVRVEGGVEGVESPMKLMVENTGSNELQEFKIIFGERVRAAEGGELNVGTVPAGSSKEAQFRGMTSLSPGISYEPMVVEYVEKGERKRFKLNVPVEVMSNNKLKVFLEGKPLPLYAGEKSKLVITVANVGNSKINALTVMAEVEGAEMQSITNEQFIGELMVNDFSDVQFDIVPKASGSMPVKVTLKYKDAEGKEHSEAYYFSANVSQRAAEGPSILLIVLALAVVLLGAYFLWWRKRGAKK